MAKKPTARPQAKSADVAHLPAGPKGADVGAFAGVAAPEQLAALALTLGVDVTGSRDERLNLAAEHMNRSQRHMLVSGLLLSALKAECEHGEFLNLVESRGFEARSAQKAIQYAHFIAGQPEPVRLRLLEMPRTKVMELAAADAEVIEQLLQDGGDEIDTLSVRGLRHRISELEAQATDLQVQRDQAEAEAEGLKKRLKRGLPDREDNVPVVVADLRAEVLALGKKAALALDSFIPLQAELSSMAGIAIAADWADAATRLAYSQLAALRVQIDGLLQGVVAELPDAAKPSALTSLTKQEIQEAARLFAELTQVHTYEAQLRAWEREQGRPQGKGRPKNKPEAPAAAEPAAHAKAARGAKGAAS